VSVAREIGRALADLGVTDAFGLVGSGNFEVTNALVASGVRFVSARHESAAVSMADGYARVARRPGVATVHQGPGLTNATTALTEAAKARTPLLLLAAETSAGAVRSNFRIDQAGLAASVGARSERIYTPRSALADLARAWRAVSEERRAVVLGLPLDVQAAEAVPGGIARPPPLGPPAPDPASVSKAADLTAGARAPVIVGGRGAVLADARDSLERLGDRIGALLATSANGHGLFAGVPGARGSPVGSQLRPRRVSWPRAISSLPSARR
jgi:thiamine pyrophosphate-dependent acetolactate synthase large subunit-like protein